jgi:hypothetical protein
MNNTTNTHTPRPWIIKSNDTGGHYLIGPSTHNTALVFTPLDAHLIATAPDLLHALKRATTLIEIWNESDVALIGYFESIIAKAEGR